MRTAVILFSAIALPCVRAEWVRKEVDVPSYQAETSMWMLKKPAPADQSVSLTVALHVEEARRNELERIFWEVSDPKHENYGKHRSVAELTDVLAVPASRVERVKAYFTQAGATSVVVAPNRDMMTVTMPVKVAQEALNTKLASFEHREVAGKHIIRASTHYSLPEDIASDVDMIGELLQFPRLRLPSLHNLQGQGSWPNDCDAGGCKGLVQPSVLVKRYKLPTSNGTSPLDSKGANSMAVAEFQGQYYEDSDLKGFSQSCHRDVTVDKVVGGNKQSAGVESELDIEYIKSVAPEIPLTVVYSAEYSLLNWVNGITSMQDAPLVNSVSYGNDEVQQSGKQYMDTCNTAFMKAGARGISILFASGDQGVCGRSGCGLLMHARFHPDFPAASPYITAVGGTDFLGNDIGEEMAWQDSGGGFSDTFDMPDYQKSAVEAYLASKDADLPPQKLWNSKGRGYPDIAALGGTKAPYCVKVEGMFSGVAGTSASCPVVSGIFARLNGLRLTAGKKPMGFLNPFIYQNPSAFQDVTAGVNTGSPTKKYGFKAIKGWDAATGFGTPDYEALAKLAMAVAEDASVVVV